MNAKQAQSARNAATSTLQESLRQLLLLEIDALISTPEPATAALRADIDSMSTARANPNDYDALFAEHLNTLSHPEDGPPHPATLARIYNQWDRDHSSSLHELNRSLAEANAQTAHQRVRSILEHTLTSVLTSSSLHGAAETSPLELMNPAAADPKRPITLTGPDGLSLPLKHWYQVLLAPLTALAERRAIRQDLCPVRLNGAKNAVLQFTGEPQHDEDAAPPSSRSRVLTGGFTLSIHHSVPHVCRIAAETLRALGQHPEDYFVKYHPKDLPAPDRQATIWDLDRPSCKPAPPETSSGD